MRRTFVVLVVSHLSQYSLQKNYNYIIIWICVSYVQSTVSRYLFFQTRLAKTAFFNDVTITSSLRSVVLVLMGHFTIFQSHGLSGWFVPKNLKSCLNLSKLRPKYYWFLFSGHSVDCSVFQYSLNKLHIVHSDAFKQLWYQMNLAGVALIIFLWSIMFRHSLLLFANWLINFYVLFVILTICWYVQWLILSVTSFPEAAFHSVLVFSFCHLTIFIIMGSVSLLNELTEFHSKPVKNVLNTGDNSNHIKITDPTSLIPLVHWTYPSKYVQFWLLPGK